MIHVEHLGMRFGRHKAVDDLSFAVAPGESLALWGPNGAGKTTAIRCILGLLRYTGNITVNGSDARRHGKAARRALGYVPQELALHDDLRAIEALHFYGRLKRAMTHRPHHVLLEVGLAEHGGKRIGELSGGMKQRLALAIALLADPPVLVLDELTASVDAEGRSGFMHLLNRLKRGGKTILFTSHRLEEIETLADRVIVLDKGRLSRETTGRELGEALGLRSMLKVFVGEDTIPQAVASLRQRGFAATPNGCGLHVEVHPRQKALPIRALADAAIEVRDFEVLTDRAQATVAVDKERHHA